jgi:alkyldihydroxyacetonephosphate synthase
VTRPTPVTEVDAAPAAVTERLGGRRVPVAAAVLGHLVDEGLAVSEDPAHLIDAGRDWWPLAVGWATQGKVPARPAAVVRPGTAQQVSVALATCTAAGVPVTPMAGRSGVCGGAVPAFGGIALDLTGLDGVPVVDEESLLADVPAGVFGPDLEAALRATGSGYTLGHWPQSMALSTVGGWVACRGAGQYSTRYGKIEDLVGGLDVVLADGRLVRTEGRGPRAATGPNLTQLFVGSEGVLGVVTSARLRIHPLPEAEGRRAFGFTTFTAGLDACRRILRRGATPAVLRLYDAVESARSFDERDRCVLIVLDEADPGLLDATLAVVDEECLRPDDSGAPGCRLLDDALVGRWLDHRNDVSQLVPLWRAGIVVDTAEVAGRWSVLAPLAEEVVGGLSTLEGTLVASVHQSHGYPDGACLYFTFAGRSPGAADGADPEWNEGYYRRAWDVLTATVEARGAAVSHHHGIGLNRARFMPDALGEGFGVLRAVKSALDPAGILNPGKLGLPSPFGPDPWP